MEIKKEYTDKEIISFLKEHIIGFQRTTSHNVKVLFQMHNFKFPNSKEFTTGCSSCVLKVKNKLINHYGL